MGSTQSDPELGDTHFLGFHFGPGIDRRSILLDATNWPIFQNCNLDRVFDSVTPGAPPRSEIHLAPSGVFWFGWSFLELRDRDWLLLRSWSDRAQNVWAVIVSCSTWNIYPALPERSDPC